MQMERGATSFGFQAVESRSVVARFDGRAALSVPRRRVAARLEPSGRRIDMTAHWRRTLRRAGEVGLGVGWTLDPNHVAGARPDVTFAAGWRLAF